MGRNPDKSKVMKRFSPSGILAIILLCSAGCMHKRYSVFGTIGGEMQKVATRNRYMLVGVKYEGGSASADVAQGNLQSQLLTNETLKNLQTEVFSDDGIRFMLRSTRLPRVEPFPWTIFTYMCSCGVLPLCGSSEWGEHLVIDVLDNPDARTTLDMHVRNDTSLSLWSPTPLLCYLGDATPLDGSEMPLSVSRHSVSFINDASSSMHVNTYEGARAYLLAVALKNMEDDGLIDGPRNRKVKNHATHSNNIDKKFEIVAFRKDDNCEHRYVFTLRCRNKASVSLKDSRELKKSLRSMIREDYLASFPDANADSLIVDFPEFSIRDGLVSGQSVVLSLSVESLRYDSSMRRGTMRVRIGENQLADVREYARRNIESLVRDKNIALDASDIPPVTTFYLLDEKSDGYVLEITFKTE